ncbi:RNA polymerase II subunit A [Carpediemonas membranifera]|uniref:RNA polymerase II subunit A C-terminal domain phosphatase SSU72 n=1 Tax=Carpediemonas membranifera TaxID=201153 RepID=A0A8J6DYM5_9EUKA|nr:RNA polymerase II subunit A [Carpediemonas membranifera]|eukprot:KAG9389543.1 RNA polymerase II subunit A [Carpediemonas membranifera]
MPNTFRTALVCASNVNRSVEAHKYFLDHGFDSALVSSYGAADIIRLPSSTGKPLSAPFSTNERSARKTTYQMLIDRCKDAAADFYAREGIIAMLERDITVKEAPESFQLTFRASRRAAFPQLVICFEEAVYVDLCRFMQVEMQTVDLIPVLVVNIETPDSIKSAGIGAEEAFRVASALGKIEPAEWIDKADGVFRELNEEKESTKGMLHTFFFV